ncbi:hypothetical protein SASPL_112214 [Salvia splendens]|uniref:Subtilisin-like protease fibronectin type-III domain-containing protein n=1 Tax=Salvia splendens TaxID=180675 RepID=A0A8X8YDX0_SALSN|nr:hypothetical protein SASPL_112214 [Salvia splendens]
MMTTAYILDSQGSPIEDVAFAFGSGHVSPQKAADPGLIYDISTKDYLTYASDFQTGDLNYPSFAVQFSSSAKNTTSTYKRRVTNVGIAVSSYAVKVSEPQGISIIVRPRVLNFRKIGQKLSYKVTFIAKGIVSTNFSFGSRVEFG